MEIKEIEFKQIEILRIAKAQEKKGLRVMKEHEKQILNHLEKKYFNCLKVGINEK